MGTVVCHEWFLTQCLQVVSRPLRLQVVQFWQSWHRYCTSVKYQSRRSPLAMRDLLSPVLVHLVSCCCLAPSWISCRPVGRHRYCTSKISESKVAVGLCGLFLASPSSPGLLLLFGGLLGWSSSSGQSWHRWCLSEAPIRTFPLARCLVFPSSILGRRKVAFGLHDLWSTDIWEWTSHFASDLAYSLRYALVYEHFSRRGLAIFEDSSELM